MGGPLVSLVDESERLTVASFGSIVTYSRKVFIPLTRLCRDVCHYCAFASTPKAAGPVYLTREQVLAIARAGVAAGCREALFTLVFGDMKAARARVVELANAAGLRGIHGGALANSAAAEAMTSLLIFINKTYQVDSAGTRITGELIQPDA